MMKGELLTTQPYVWRVSARARRIRITVAPGGVVTIVRPRSVSLIVARHFVARKDVWLMQAIKRMQAMPMPPSAAEVRRDYQARKAQALAFVVRRARELNQQYGFVYHKIAIRNQRSRWGSCSRRGTLSFNYRILDLPQPLADYLIIHELSHLQIMNHGREFWALVERGAPEYRAHRRELRRYLDKK